MRRWQTKVELHRLGRIPYRSAWLLQKLLHQERVQADLDGVVPPAGPADVALMLQHPPVYTLGRGSSPGHVRFDPRGDGAAELWRCERGGEVTFHGPGQLVVYPIFRLGGHKKDLRWYLNSCEEVVIQVLAELGLQGEREPGAPGVWVNGSKVAAAGISVSRWVTMHGIALNVDPDLRYFDRIVPCGLAGRAVTSLRQLLQRPVPLPEIEHRVKRAIQRVFDVNLLDRSVMASTETAAPHDATQRRALEQLVGAQRSQWILSCSDEEMREMVGQRGARPAVDDLAATVQATVHPTALGHERN